MGTGCAGKRGRRVGLATLVSILLVLAVLAGGASGDPASPRAAEDRSARADGSANATKYLSGLLDAAGSAAGLTGPQGFLLGAALLVIKEAFLGSGDEAQDAYAKLTEIGDQIESLRKNVGEEFFKLQVGKTDGWITEIRETERDLRSALEKAKMADNQQLTEQQREEMRIAFQTRMKEFLNGAKKLAEDRIAAKLNEALVDHQEVADLKNPEKRPALIPALRRTVAAERFLTAAVAQRMRAFFEYYEWWQTRLAAVLSEYYVLGGPCAWSDAWVSPQKCKPDTVTAKDRISEIKSNIDAQRALAGMPRKSLGQEPFQGRVFIDTKNDLMWDFEPTYRSSAKITQYGAFHECGMSVIDYPHGPGCQLAAQDQFAGRADWFAPLKRQAKSLFDGQQGDSIAWMRSIGVTFNNTANTRFPGYGGAKLASRAALWLRDTWHIGPPTRPTIFDKYTRDLQADLLELSDRDGTPYRNPQLNGRVVARECPVHQSLIPYYPIFSKPDCRNPDQSVGGFILWVRGVTAAERADYYITPG